MASSDTNLSSRSVIKWKKSLNFSWAMTKLPKWHVRPAKTRISLASTLPDQSSLSTWKGFGSLAIHTAHREDWSDWADAQLIEYSLCVQVISSPEPKAHRWAYSTCISRHPSSVCQHFQTTSPLKPWSQFFPYFTYSIYRWGGMNNCVFCSNQIILAST